LMRRFGLVYGAIDLRLTPEGRYVFLEINPAGQFLYVEHATRQPIAAALAKALIEKPLCKSADLQMQQIAVTSPTPLIATGS
jgi:D-alanine-D-alanine ligase-like ATP-grasp enzyme